MRDVTVSSDPPRPVEFEERDLLLRGIRVRYRDGGRGPALLLLHGFLTDHRVWRKVVGRLARHFRVIVPDLPGFGASERPTRYSFTREALADTLCDLLAGVGAPRAHVVGHQLGGTVALTMAADHPEVVDRLVLINAVAFDVKMPWRSRVPLLPVVGSFLFKQVYGRMMFHGYFERDVFALGFGYDRAVVDAWFDAFDPPEARECAHKALTAAMVDVSALGPRLPKVRAPTAVVWGERDRHYPSQLGYLLAHEIAGARLELVPGAGHTPAEEQPDATADVILRHLLGRVPDEDSASKPGP